MRYFIFVLLTTSLFTLTSHATDYYVDGLTGFDLNNGHSATQAFRTPDYGLTQLQPGDTLHILPTATYTGIYIHANGTASAPITVTGGSSSVARTTIIENQNFGIQITDGSSWIRVSNFDITSPQSAAIFIAAPNPNTQQTHHVTVSNNRTHDSGLLGISAMYADYITVDHNLVENNSGLIQSGICGSGISLHEMRNFDSNPAIHNVITNNIVRYNSNYLISANPVQDFHNSNVCFHTDGNGIIIDDTRNIQSPPQYGNPVYQGSTLIANNLVYRNGGRGISIFHSDNVYVVSNSLYENNQDPFESAWNPGELMGVDCGNVTAYDNILYHDGATQQNRSLALSQWNQHYAISMQDCNGGPLTFSNTAIYYPGENLNNGQFAYNLPTGTASHANTNSIQIGAGMLLSDPLYQNATLGHFRVSSSSPALNSGIITSMVPTTDIRGRIRYNTASTSVTLGALQEPYPAACFP